MQLLIGMSIKRYFAPRGTAGFARSFVKGYSRVPAPPPKMIAKTRFMRLSAVVLFARVRGRRCLEHARQWTVTWLGRRREPTSYPIAPRPGDRGHDTWDAARTQHDPGSPSRSPAMRPGPFHASAAMSCLRSAKIVASFVDTSHVRVGSRTGARTVGGGFPAERFRLLGGCTVPP